MTPYPSKSKKIYLSLYLGYGPEGLSIRSLIQDAARLDGRSLSEFITRASLTAALKLLNDK